MTARIRLVSPIRCTFCGADEEQTSVLIVRGQAIICMECVKLADAVPEYESKNEDEPTAS